MTATSAHRRFQLVHHIGRIAGLTIDFTMIDPSVGKRGVSAFPVPTGTPGPIIAKPEHKLGQRASDTCALVLEHGRFKKSVNLVGDEFDLLGLYLQMGA